MLEFDLWVHELNMRRGSAGGSSEPFTVHLLTGGLLFESLLKHFYPNHHNGDPNKTIGRVFQTANFKQDFNLPPQALETGADSLKEIYDLIGGSNSLRHRVLVAARLRNTTGHNLIWDAVFTDDIIYTALFEQVMNAVLYIVDAKGR